MHQLSVLSKQTDLGFEITFDCRLMTLPLANPAGYAGPAGRRPPPLRIVWAALRNVRLLFGVPGASSMPAEKEIERAAAQRLLESTRRLARACIEVRPVDKIQA